MIVGRFSVYKALKEEKFVYVVFYKAFIRPHKGFSIVLMLNEKKTTNLDNYPERFFFEIYDPYK